MLTAYCNGHERYNQLLTITNWSDRAIYAAFSVGSRVHGTASDQSDYDYVFILSDKNQKQDILFYNNINIVLYGISEFQNSLNNGNVFAFEAFFAPPFARLKEPSQPFSYEFDLIKIYENALHRSHSDATKAKKIFNTSPFLGKKKFFHSIRILMFAEQLLRLKKIEDFEIPKEWYEEIMTNPSNSLFDYESLYNERKLQISNRMADYLK